MARPKLEPRAARSIVYGVRLREQEAAALRRIADLVQEPPSRLIWEAVTGRPDFFDDDKIELRRLSREMNAIGRNLNMLVRAIHRAALAPLAVGPPRSPSPVRTARVGGRGRS